MPIRQLHESEVTATIAETAVPVVIDFWAAWCGPCRAVAPQVERIADAYGDRGLVFCVDIDAAPSVAASFGVRSIPTIMRFDRGAPTATIIGAHPAETIVHALGIPPLA